MFYETSFKGFSQKHYKTIQIQSSTYSNVPDMLQLYIKNRYMVKVQHNKNVNQLGQIKTRYNRFEENKSTQRCVKTQNIEVLYKLSVILYIQYYINI